MALTGPNCDQAVYGQVTMAFPGGNIIQEAPEPIDAALALVAANPPGGASVAISIRVLDKNGIEVQGCCPDGFYYDAAANTCKLGAPPPPPPPPPPPSPPPPPAPPDPDTDDLGYYFQLLIQQLVILINAIQPLINPPKPSTELDPCCKALLVVLSNMLRQVTKIANAITITPTPGVPPIDLLPVQAELKCICDALAAASSTDAPTPTAIRDGTKSIADAITNTAPTDLKPLVDVLEKLYKTIDVPIGVYQDMADRGLISPQLLQAISTGEFGAGAVSVIVDFVKTSLTWLLAHIGIKWTGAVFSLSPLVSTIADVIDVAVTDALTLGAAPLYPAIRGLVDAVVGVLQPTQPPTIGTAYVDPDLLLAKTLAPITIINGVMLVASYFGWDVSEQLREYVDLASEFIGLQEVRELKVGQMMKYGPMREAEMRAKGTFRQELPGYGALAGWSARGLLSESRYRNLTGAVGLPVELIDPSIEAAKSGLNARMLLRLAGTGLFTDADVADELTFGGTRQVSQHRLMLAATYLGTEPERGKLRSALERFYTAGLISDNDLVSRLQSAEHNTDRFNLLLETVQLEKQITLAHEYEGAYSREFLAGLLDAPGYQSALEALGLQPPDVAARMFRDETHLNVTTSIQAARQARAEQRATAAAERKTAIEAYRTGNSNPATLSAALLATGLTPVQVAALTTFQVLQSAGVLRWIYGLKLPPSQATLLREQVADLTRQREIELLTDTQYVSALQALHIPAVYIQALRAGANAHISPKTKAILTPPVS